MPQLREIGFAVLLLGCYHVALQTFTSSSADQPLRRRANSVGGDSGGTSQPRQSAESAEVPRIASTNAVAPVARPDWRPPFGSNLRPNPPARALLAQADPRTATLHFTFGSFAMMDFLINWRHFVQRVGLSPAIVGAADHQMIEACTQQGIAALGIVEGLDVWTYEQSANTSTVVQEGKSDWKYYRHHKSSFLELGLVKVAFLWELLLLGFDVLISDLDVVWLAPHYERWMTYRYPERPPLPEAALLAMADVLVSTDELDEAYDAHGLYERWPFGVGWGRRHPTPSLPIPPHAHPRSHPRAPMPCHAIQPVKSDSTPACHTVSCPWPFQSLHPAPHTASHIPSHPNQDPNHPTPICSLILK